MNVNNKGMDLRKPQLLRAVISHPDDPTPRLHFIEEFGELYLSMSGRQGKREKQLTKATFFYKNTTSMFA